MAEQTTDEERRALVISAHPDDIEFGAAGTIAQWVDAGWLVSYVIVTNGQKGVQNATQDPDEYGLLRQGEARAAAAMTGVTDLTFLEQMDSEVVYGPSLQKALAREFRRHRPHRLVTMDPAILPSPTLPFINHPDHRHVATATLDIVQTGGTTAAIFPELELEEGLAAWKGLEEVWIMGPGGGETVVDISSTYEQKMQALECHASQVPPDLREWFGGRLADIGKSHGYAYAEAFRVLKLR